MSDALGLSIRDVTGDLLAYQWSPLQYEGARLGTGTSAATRFLSGPLPLCQRRLAPSEEAGYLELLPLHPVLAQEFGRESDLVRALATREPLTKLRENLALIESLFSTRKDGDVAMAAVLSEVIEGIVVAAVGLEAAFEYMTACLG